MSSIDKIVAVTESGLSSADSGIVAPQQQHTSSKASPYPLQGQQVHQSQRQLLQHHPSMVNNGIPQSQMYQNCSLAQVAAYAAAANAAQQAIHAQMGIVAPNGNNPSIQGGNVGGFNHDSVNMSMGGININEQIAALVQQHQQTQMNAHTQAQVAAMLAAGSVGNGMVLNQGRASTPALAAAQAYTLMLNQQQALANHQQQQQQSMQVPVTSPTPPPLPPQPKSQSMQPEQTSAEPPTATAPQQTVKVKARKATPVIQQSAQTLNGNPSPAKRKKPNNKVKKQKLQNHKEVTGLTSNASSVPQNQHMKHGPASSFSQQITASPFQIPVATSQLAPVHHSSMPAPQHGHCMFQATVNPIVLSQMQSWKLNQLESHVQLLQDTNQPIPHAVQILLSEARKVEQKRAAKRIANRKSACTSRARKKALVAEMTKTNARLRRQAVILSLLPDLVIAITDDGTITFCSTQVERVLHHKVSNMIGANIEDVLTPASRTALSALIKKLVSAEKVILEESNNKEGDESGRSSNSGNTVSAAIVSEQSDPFPLAVVKVKSHNHAEGRNYTSDSLGNGNNAVTDGAMSLSATQSSLTNTHQSNSNSDNVSSGSGSNESAKRKSNGNSDGDSSSSSEPTNLRKANDALSRNVRFHNEQLKIKEDKKKLAHTDDVTGDSVTANNANARLSSLMKASENGKVPVEEGKDTSTSNMETLEDNSSSSSSDSLLAGVEDRPKRKRTENTSEDSGYRESGDSDPSREDSASSTSDVSNRRSRPLAPTCNICLIRDDLTTIWCEVTSSIRTVTTDDDQTDIFSNEKKNDVSSGSSDDQQASNCSTVIQTKELLLCLRPTRDGTEKVSEDLRFFPKKLKGPDNTQEQEPNILAGANVDATTSSSYKSDLKISNHKNRPMKKRPLPKEDVDSPAKDSLPKKDIIETEKSVVESLMLMSNK